MVSQNKKPWQEDENIFNFQRLGCDLLMKHTIDDHQGLIFLSSEEDEENVLHASIKNTHVEGF